MFKNNVGSLVLVLGVVSCVCACGSGGTTPATGGKTAAGGTSATGGSSAAAGGTMASGGTSATGGASATGGSAVTGGAISSGGVSAGGASGTAAMTLADACAHNCAFAYNLQGCSTTQDVCVQSCMKTFDNTSAVNADLGKQYTEMMVCVATDPSFSSSADFICAKPNSPLNLWSPAGTDVNPNSNCEDAICLWNCDDATHGDMDPWVDIRCTCSSVH